MRGLISALLLLFSSAASSQSAVEGRVVQISEAVALQLGDRRIRLQGIVAPLAARPEGQAARSFMEGLVLGRALSCTLTGEQFGGGQVAICYLGTMDIAEKLVGAGLALDCPRLSRGRYRAMETAARIAGHDLSRVYPLPAECR